MSPDGVEHPVGESVFQWRTGVNRVTIDEVARSVGVSKATVSAVINRKATVKAETRKAVLSAMKELNYRPRASARTLKSRGSDYAIGLLIRELGNPFYTGIALGVMEYARSKGHLVLIASSEGNHLAEESITGSFSSRNIEGAIIAPVLEGTAEIEHLFRLKMINFPFVLLEKVKGIQANVVSIDNISAISKTVKYLIDNGHSRIIHFAGPKHASHTYERIDGFNRAYSESHFAFQSDMIVPCGDHFEDGHRTCLEYFRNRSQGEYPTAIVCYNDLVALGVMAALDEMGISVPDQISLTGNDDIPFSKNVPVKLTTIRAPIVELGRKAAEILIRQIDSPKSLPVENVVYEAELIVRDSTRALHPASPARVPAAS